MQLNLRQVEAFRAVMVAGSVTKAAEMMHITQPAVSRLIADFELAVGISLFDRARRRLTPTSECHALFAEVQRTFAGMDHIARAADAIRNMQRGHLSIVSMPIASTSFLPDVIARFSNEFPDISVSLWTWPRDQALEWISSQQYDLGILTLPVADPALKVEPFPSSSAVCLLPKKHKLAQKEFIEAEDLQNENFISLTTGSSFRHDVDRVFEDRGVSRIMKVEARSATAICSLVQREVGVSILGPIAVYGRSMDRLAIRPFRPGIPFQAGVVYQPNVPLSAIARRLADICHDQISKVRFDT